MTAFAFFTYLLTYLHSACLRSAPVTTLVYPSRSASRGARLVAARLDMRGGGGEEAGQAAVVHLLVRVRNRVRVRVRGRVTWVRVIGVRVVQLGLGLGLWSMVMV